MINFTAKIQAISKQLLPMLVAVFCLTSCSGLLFIPKDRPVLIENIVQVNGENTRSDEDYDIMRQRANRSVGNVRLFLSMYQWGDRIGKNWVGRGLKNIGEAPTFYDSIERIKTADQLQLHYFNQGLLQCAGKLYTYCKTQKGEGGIPSGYR